MATNFEFYKDEIWKLTREGKRPARVNGELVDCSFIDCDECEFREFEFSCGATMLNWLYAEHIEKPKLTKRERMFCEVVQTGWIARNPNGLFWFRDEPKRAVSIIWNSDKYKNISDFEIGFEFIKCADEKHWAVEDLLKLEVMEDA